MTTTNEERAARMAAVLSESAWARGVISHELDEACAEAAVAAAPRWIPVGERLPEQGTRVLVTVELPPFMGKPEINVAELHGERWIWDLPDALRTDLPKGAMRIVAWQPLPAPWVGP